MLTAYGINGQDYPEGTEGTNIFDPSLNGPMGPNNRSLEFVQFDSSAGQLLAGPWMAATYVISVFQYRKGRNNE